MNEKKPLTISLSIFLIILAILAVLVIIIIGSFIKINSLKNTANILQDKISNTIIDDTNTNNNEISNSAISDDENSNYSNSSNLDVSYTTYSKNGIQFNYPSTFKQTSDTFKTSGFEAIEDTNKNRFQINDTILSGSMTLKELVENEKALTLPNGSKYRTIVKNEEYINLASGVKGYRFECIADSNSYQIIFITQKDSTAYQFTFTIEDKSKYDNYIESANKILNSIMMK